MKLPSTVHMYCPCCIAKQAGELFERDFNNCKLQVYCEYAKIIGRSGPHAAERGGFTQCSSEVASPVQLVRPWPDHFSVGHRSVLRLQRQSEDETIGPDVPRKLAYAFLVIVPALLPADQEPDAA